MSKSKLSKQDFFRTFHLYSKQPWIIDKESELIELINNCDDDVQKALLIDLLLDFHFLEDKSLNYYLKTIAQYIINDSGFTEANCQVAAVTYDDEADSSQKIVDYIKMPLHKMGWGDVKTVNRYGAIIGNVKAGKKEIIFIDEFVGSGKTMLGRVKQLASDLKEYEYKLKMCFIAGMDAGLAAIEDTGIEVFCPLRLQKGIADKYTGSELAKMNDAMLSLEAKLLPDINGNLLSTYTFGYGKAEALYSLEGARGNTPNSVFPVFWWPKNATNNKRNTLLTRFEKGLI